ncbi:MAG: DUF296 domain-containing protein [Ruminiclostridium sp.]|nr:DUF296 domain-containing protein [Ruminiclostridium sp.]
MKATEGRIGRVFVLRLEDGDMVPESIEKFALDNGIEVGHATLLGGIKKGNIVVGPRNMAELPPVKMTYPIDDAYEIVASGLIAPDEKMKPVLHIHGALGRSEKSICGCLREGVETWLVGEAIIYEIIGADAIRILDDKSGFVLLNVYNKIPE